MENIKYTILVLYYNIYTIYTNFFLKNGEEFPLFVPRVISCDRNILRIHQHRIYNSSKSWDHNLFATIFFRVRKIFTFKFLYIYIASNVYVINIFPFALYNFFSPFPPISPHARTPHIRPRSPPPPTPVLVPTTSGPNIHNDRQLFFPIQNFLSLMYHARVLSRFESFFFFFYRLS